MENKPIPLSSPDITNTEKESVCGVLAASSLALGPKLKKFEQRLAEYIGVKYAVAVNSGTSGLHLLVRAFGIKEGDEVITTPFSFVASANCVLFERAKPVFVDIDPLTLNIDPAKIEQAITPKTKAILGVDIFGYPADWKKIQEIAQKHNLKIIEDSCEALGAEYDGIKCGNFGQAAVFAFYPNKQMTTGEGGMIVTNDSEIADHCRSMANQGREAKDGKWLEHIRLGYNYRMSDINAALGVAQLSRIDEILEKRNRVAERYNELLENEAEISVFYRGNGRDKRSWFVYVVTLSKEYSRRDRDSIIEKMGQNGIQCGNYFQCIHLQPFYKNSYGYKEGLFPVAEFISGRTIALPFFNNITEEEIGCVVNNLKDAIKKR
jgi:perosamine synthetase